MAVERGILASVDRNRRSSNDSIMIHSDNYLVQTIEGTPYRIVAHGTELASIIQNDT
jgi:hypothetical protein